MTIADRYGSFLFDLDGVLYRGDQPIPHASDAVAWLRRMGKGLSFVTNNSGRTPAAVMEHLRSVGIDAREGEIATSAIVTARILAERGVRTAFVIGERGIVDALRDAGIAIVEGLGATAEVVVVGWDRAADYAKLSAACVHVERGAGLVATNADASYPSPEGRLPGAGALLAAVVTTTGATPEIVGKPHPALLRAAHELAGGLTPLLIGDRLDTDIAGAAALGWDSLLVLTGISTRTEAAAADPAPTYVAEDLAEAFGSPPDPSDRA